MIKSKLTSSFLSLPGLVTIAAGSLFAESDIEQTARLIQHAQESRAASVSLATVEAGEVNPATQAALLVQNKATDTQLPGDSQVIRAAGERLKQVVSTASPEAKILIAQSNSAAPTSAPQPERVVPREQVGIVDVSKAKPQPLRPTTLEPESQRKNPGATVITASGAAFFDSKEAIGVFTDDVVVKDPRFHLTCDVLEVFMKKQSQGGNGAAKAANTEASGSSEFENSDIDHAIAKGRKVVIQKLNEEGKLQIGICRHATYDGKTGDIILRDFPQVQSDTRSATATDRSTVITLKNNGQFEVKGPHTTVLGKSEGNNSNQGQGAGTTGAAPAAN